MRWRKFIPRLLLFALAAVLAAVNTWFTAERSTIPLTLNTRVLGKEVRPEKHAGQDDVYLLQLAGIGQVQVDRELYVAVIVGESLQKERLSRELRHDEKILPLHWSRDHQGMLLAMPLCLCILAVVLGWVLNASRLETC